MDKTNLTFEQQGLAVDWVSFTFSSCSREQERKLISSFYALGFNLYRLDRLTNNCSAEGLPKLSKLKSPILVDNNNSFQILIVGYFEKTSLVFPGLSGQAFYNLAKNRQVDWALLNPATLSRFDINYCRICNSQEIDLLPNFFASSYKKLRSSGKNNSASLTPKGDIFTVGCRRSQNFSRIYLKGTTLKFENEMKGNFLKKYQSLFLSNAFVQFEHDMCSHYLLRFGKRLCLDYCFTDWLVNSLRPGQEYTFKNSIKSDYLLVTSTESIHLDKNFILFLMLLQFAGRSKFDTGLLGSTRYRNVKFSLQNFSKYVNPKIRPTNYYQVKKLLLFLTSVQSNLFVSYFAHNEFGRLATIPKITIKKSKSSDWFVSIWLLDDLCNHCYPFILPNLFNLKLKNYQFSARLWFVQIFSSVHVEKVFIIENFFNSHNSALSNGQKMLVRQELVELVKLFHRSKLIEPRYKILVEGSPLSVSRLTRHNIVNGFVIYENFVL